MHLVRKLKHSVKNTLIAIFSSCLQNEFLFGARLINFMLPKNNFGPNLSFVDFDNLQLEKRVSEYREQIYSARNFQHVDMNLNLPDKITLENNQISIFVTHRDINSLTSEVFLDLARSYGSSVGDYLVVDEDGLIIESRIENHSLDSSINFSGHIFKDESVTLFIFFELNFITKQTSLFLFDKFPQITTKYFVICFDLWREQDRDIINSCQLENLIFLHMDSESASLIKGRQLFNWIFVGHNLRQRFELPNLPLSLYFSGNLKTQDRRNWILITKILSRRFSVPLSLGIFQYVKWDKRDSQYDYKNKLSLHHVILGLSQKTETRSLITFRSIEAIALGRVLLQQELPNSKPLSQYAVPYFHYMPFQDVIDLAAVIQLMKEEPEMILEIGSNAQILWNQKFNNKILWNQLLTLKLL